MKQAILDTDILSYLIDQRYPEVVASAIEYGRPLVTNNTKHYQRSLTSGFRLSYRTGAMHKADSKAECSLLPVIRL